MHETFYHFGSQKNVSFYKKQLCSITAERTGLTPHIILNYAWKIIFEIIKKESVYKNA